MLNKKHHTNLNINEKQFSNSIDFGLTIDDKNGKTRKLESFENLHFEIRLKMPVITDETIIYEATCVQYSNKQPDTSCESWYDLTTFEVVCYCAKQGSTVNVLDKVMTNVSKFKQFPAIKISICKYIFFKLFS